MSKAEKAGEAAGQTARKIVDFLVGKARQTGSALREAGHGAVKGWKSYNQPQRPQEPPTN